MDQNNSIDISNLNNESDNKISINFASSKPPQLLPSLIEATISNCYCATASIISIFVNIISITIIRKNKNLQTNSFTLISIQAIISCQMSIGYLTNALLSLSQTQLMPRLQCTLIYLISFTSAAPLSAILPCSIGVDRLIAIALPHRYKESSKYVLKLVLSMCFVFAGAHLMIALATMPGSIIEKIVCVTSFSSLNQIFTTYYQSLQLFFLVCAVVIYSCVELFLHIKTYKIQSNMNSVQANSIAQQMTILPLIRALMIAYIVFGILPHLAITISPFVDKGRHQTRIVYHAAACKATLALIDFTLLNIRCQEFSKSLKKCLPKNSVSTILVHPFA